MNFGTLRIYHLSILILFINLKIPIQLYSLMHKYTNVNQLIGLSICLPIPEDYNTLVILFLSLIKFLTNSLVENKT